MSPLHDRAHAMRPQIELQRRLIDWMRPHNSETIEAQQEMIRARRVVGHTLGVTTRASATWNSSLNAVRAWRVTAIEAASLGLEGTTPPHVLWVDRKERLHSCSRDARAGTRVQAPRFLGEQRTHKRPPALCELDVPAKPNTHEPETIANQGGPDMNEWIKKVAVSDHQVSIAEAEKFLELLDPEASAFIFQTYDDNDERTNPSLSRSLCGSLKTHAASLASLNAEGAAVAVCINEMKGEQRNNDSIKRYRAVWCDYDAEKQKETKALSQLLKAFPLEPSIVVETSPGNYHFYWLVATDPRGAGIMPVPLAQAAAT